MSNGAGRARQAEKSRLTRERVLSSTVSLIRNEGFPSASPSRITQQTGLSWGAVQHHFGSKDRLLKEIVLRSRDLFNETVEQEDFAGLDIDERISAFVDAAWRHYQSDVFLASVEIAFWHRNSGFELPGDVTDDEGRTGQLIEALLDKVFGGLGVPMAALQEANIFMHCALTGFAFHSILSDHRRGNEAHLASCKRAMRDIVLRPENGPFAA